MWVSEDMELVRIYYQRGNVKHSKLNFEVKDPPTSGWQNAVLMRGKKRSTIFCPYTLQAWTVSNNAAEITERRDIYHNHDDWKKLQALLNKNWDEYQRLGMHKDYDTAALVFKKMGVTAPEQKIKGGDIDTRKKGGKDAEGSLKKPVKLASKRGKFLEWFLQADAFTRSIREAMAEFSMSRSNALSYLYMLKKDHGLGYELVGDNAVVSLPSDCANPFDVPWGELQATEDEDFLDEDPEDLFDDDDDSWLD